MRKTIIAFCCLFLSCMAAAQKSRTGTPARHKAVKWAPLSLILGSVSVGGEYNRNRNSATFRLGVPVSSRHALQVFETATSLRMQAFSFMGGYRRYLSQKKMRGFYLEPFLNYVRHRANGTGKGKLGGRTVTMEYSNRLSALGAGAQLGVQFIIKRRIVLDLFMLGPLMNYGKSDLFAWEVGSTRRWTAQEAADATKKINELAGKYPFIRNHVAVDVNAAARTASTQFRGFVPGIRTGFSAGIVF